MGTAVDGGSWQPGGPTAPPPAKKSALPKILLFGGIGVVVLALIIGGFAFWNYQQQVEADKKVVLAAQETVQGYLDAVATGDAEKALGYAATKPDGPLLTNEVAQAAAKAAGIKVASVDPAVATKDKDGKWTKATVHASYTVGDKTVSRDFPLTRSGDAWKIDKVTGTVSLGKSSVPFKINGASITDTTSTEALPGTYAITSDDEVFEFQSKSFTVTEPGSQVKWLADTKPTDKALSAAKALLVNRYQECLKDTNNLAQDNCPFGFKLPPGVSLVKGSVRFTPSGDPFSGAKWVKVSDKVYSMTVTVTMSVKATGKKGKDEGPLTASNQKFQAIGTVELGSNNYVWTRKTI